MNRAQNPWMPRELWARATFRLPDGLTAAPRAPLMKAVLGSIGVIWGGALAIGWVAGMGEELPGVQSGRDLGRWLALAAALALVYYGGRYLREGLTQKRPPEEPTTRYVEPRSLPPPRS